MICSRPSSQHRQANELTCVFVNKIEDFQLLNLNRPKQKANNAHADAVVEQQNETKYHGTEKTTQRKK